jgi:hypothetical protein
LMADHDVAAIRHNRITLATQPSPLAYIGLTLLPLSR